LKDSTCPLSVGSPSRLKSIRTLCRYALERGDATGAERIAGRCAAVTFPPAGQVLGLTVFAAGFGGWMSSMVGAGLHSSRLKEFAAAIHAGQLLMLIDVPGPRLQDIEALVLRHHPGAESEGTESRMPIFPRARAPRPAFCMHRTAAGRTSVAFRPERSECRARRPPP
jgi:hypothetical protein